MARKSKHAVKVLPRAARRPSPTHTDAEPLVAARPRTPTKNLRKTGPAKPRNTLPGSPGYGSSAASVTSSNQEVEGSGSDGADADEDEDDEGDGDEMAPSGTVIASNVDQTGQNVAMESKLKSSIGGGRRHLTSNVATKKQHARRHNCSKSLKHKEGQNAESDDDDYNGVDLISDSEEEEPTVEQLEEKVIIESEEEYDCSAPPKLPSISDDGWTGFEGFDLQGDLFLSDVPYFDEQIGRTDPHILAEEIAIFNSTDFTQNFYDIELPPRLTPPRRVRFAEDVQDSHRTSAIASDTEHSDNGSPWAASEEDGPISRNHESEEEDNDSSSGKSSGYETDLGETTEEEDVPASATTRPQALLRRTSMSSFQGDSQGTPTPRRKLPPTPAGYRWGPHMGSWVADPTKPMAIVDSTGTRLVIYPPQRQKERKQYFASLGSSASSANSSPRPRNIMTQCSLPKTHYNEPEPSVRSDQDPVSPMFASSPNLMMSGLLSTGASNENLPGGQVLGPPEAFFPFTNFDAGGNVIMNEEDEEDEEDEDDLLNLNDFIDFGDDSDDTDHEGAIAEPHSPSASSMASGVDATPKPEKISSTEPFTPSLINHFDKGVVTAFRRNQYNQKTTQRRPSECSMQRAKFAFKGPRQAAADEPLSPSLKKRRLSDAFEAEKGDSPHGLVPKRRSLIAS